ncbi:hypothetical protein ACTFRJ_21300 [Bacillus cereus group sp. MYBK15-2]|uniref:hypothetical protein n=1 Tax=Bacillus cereus group TaxID=86661 RepID=UPI001C8B7806|nr:hypothetical protein [Bacillus cereus]MBX9158521.1 hypothetical protein [Bacillus cereus]
MSLIAAKGERKTLTLYLHSGVDAGNGEVRYLFNDKENNSYEWWTRTPFYYNDSKWYEVRATVVGLNVDVYTGVTRTQLKRVTVLSQLT